MNTQTDTTANDLSRERLRSAVREILDGHRDGTTDTGTAEQAILDAAQQWVVEGYVINAAHCPGSGGTVDRWHEATTLLYAPDDDAPDPGPYADGERVACPRCAADVPVTPIANTLRSAGRQYVARFAQH